MRASILLAVCVMCSLSGCGGEREAALRKEIIALKNENQALSMKCAESEAKAASLEQQAKTLSELSAEVRAQGIYELQSVGISRFTGLYDKDEDGTKEKLIVYVQPIDAVGDTIKAAGEAVVELWNLNREPEEALLGKWTVTAEELKELWFDTLLSRNYRLTFDVGDKAAASERPLTVKVNFTDYVSGKTFSEQMALER